MNKYRYRDCCNCNSNGNNTSNSNNVSDCGSTLGCSGMPVCNDEYLNQNDNMMFSKVCSAFDNNIIKPNSCACGFDMNVTSNFPDNPMYGQSYVPIQTMNRVFNPEVGLKMGTIFPELVSPYAPCQSIREIEYLKNSNQIGEGCNR